MSADKFQKRLQALFADLERLASDPRLEGAAVRRDLDLLRARLTELEAEFEALRKKAPVKAASRRTKQSPSKPELLYEK